MRKIILFQGDSITDAGRDYSEKAPNSNLGQGYVTMIAGELLSKRTDVDIMNRAHNGFRAADIYGTWQEDALNIDYSLLSILIGINDIGFRLRLGRGSDIKRFEFIYDRLIYEAMESHPDSAVVLCQPYLFKRDLTGIGNEGGHKNDIYRNWEEWDYEMKQAQEVVRKLAKKYKTMYAPFGDALAEASKNSPVELWTPDCIHPTPASSYVMAKTWMEATKDFFDTL